ncbi:hypothetical protein J3E69DRAFT_366034 [Trichoderma sp. SZMC 28015]
MAAADDSLMIMIDQLWCWVLDDKTILSCFPSHHFQYNPRDFTDIYKSMLESCAASETALDLFSNLVKEATTYLFRQDNKSFLDLLETFRWVARQVQLFENFNKTDLRFESIRDLPELKLVLEVADILDELKMIRNLADKQREVLKSLIMALCHLNPSQGSDSDEGGQLSVITQCTFGDSTIFNIYQQQKYSADSAETTKRLAAKIQKGASRDAVVSADETLLLLIAEVDKLTQEGENTHQMLLNLLDLKQTTAALEEARSTTQQGRIIMLFTIITIIFLPLSFFTSYFGQNVSELTGDTSNPTSWELWRIGNDIAASYKCEECAATFHTARYLVNHCRLEHADKDLPRPEFANDQEQDAAVMAYWDRYVCTECGYRFSDSGHFERHKAWHKDDRPWTWILTDEKPFPCEDCNKSFKRKEALVLHRKDAHLEAEIDGTCDKCGKVFESLSKLH